VVDHTELDADGFLVATIGHYSHAIDDIAAQIYSLEARAASRDNEALASADGAEQYMLSLESRELRKQARILKSRRMETTAGELRCRTDTKDFDQFEAGLAAE
jgi:VCBS repeat-containing protein